MRHVMRTVAAGVQLLLGCVAQPGSAADPLEEVLAKARVTLNGTFNAGGSYADVWARDTATFIAIAAEVNPSAVCEKVLLGFFRWQSLDGELPGGYSPSKPTTPSHGAKPFPACLGGTPVCKNDAETDQESSVVQAVRRYFDAVGPAVGLPFVTSTVDGVSVLGRLELALEWLILKRLDSATGLLWGATTLDWGDVQPQKDVKDERLLGPNSHLAIDVYDNAMFVGAIDDFLYLCNATKHVPKRDWVKVKAATTAAVRTHLWNTTASKFIPHVYFKDAGALPANGAGHKAGSPFPADFDEGALYYHGGTAQAALAGLMSKAELSAALATMNANVAKAGGKMTVGLTIYPPYPKDPTMPEWSYQNGGDWAWFGGRVVQALVKHGLLAEARATIAPMASRVLAHSTPKAAGFYEWWGKDGSPQGSDNFHGAAGVLGAAIKELQAAEVAEAAALALLRAKRA
jgi:hypothetical protein